MGWVVRCELRDKRRGGEGNTTTQRDRETDTQIDRQTDRHTDRHTDRQTDTQTHRQTHRHTDRGPAGYGFNPERWWWWWWSLRVVYLDVAPYPRGTDREHLREHLRTLRSAAIPRRRGGEGGGKRV
jgi:hypothetical protein